MTPKRAKTDLGDAHVFLTGGTGFVGQAVLERLLSTHPGTRVTLLVRTKGSAAGEDRVRTLLRKPVFRSWREAVGDEGVEAAVRERIRVVEGGLGSVPPLPDDIDVVIHSASTVSFDPPIDQAFDTNVGGAIGLYEALRASGSTPHVVHVSTCYVGGLRKGVVPEARLGHEIDWRAEYAAAKSARERVELHSRQPAQLREFMDRARAVHGKEGPQAVARASEQARIDWVTRTLVDAGRTRAESLGWTDVYTLTKAFAERAAEELWAGTGGSLSVVRPAIIESALQHPFPGWIDGFKVADPLILAYGRGLLPEFPGLPDSVLDIIPVDHVVNAILAAAANPPKSEPEYFHIASGASNPLPFHRMFENVNEYFTANPMPTPGDGHVRVPTWRFPGGRKVERALRRSRARLERRERWLTRLPSTTKTRAQLAELGTKRSDLETLENFSELYRAYVQTEIIFDDTNARALHAALPAKVRADRGFDVTAIDWEDYLQKVHFPAITTLTRAFSRRPEATSTEGRPAKQLPERTDVVAVFDLEGTVVDTNLVEQYLWVRSSGFGWAAWPASVASILAQLPGYLRAERRDRGEFIRTFLRRYEGMTADRLSRIVGGGYADTMLGHTATAALERAAAHRAAGHRTVLVTGSIGTLTEPVAAAFDEVVASEMHVKDGQLTGYLSRPPLVDEARANWLRQYADRGGYDLGASYGYGDSHADLVWLELLGHPHAVNPDSRLAREAGRRRWRIDTWKSGSRSANRALMTRGTAPATREEGADGTR
ncbi:SDR family oxidoreductase [Homoserinibacter sp. GY 40078]|uniref:SDR family oxidoreductase n=1 Tax=Homoserinibacter sp. GY 40078 TaxID=2603275 RepID=UPI0011CAE5B0|nr:SDR family oxidoreductase [Homoserinibacter sp. GY 40078]TXK18620.1 NAD-dependent epimerase/dehydratase family protein [Homoserinibacter sp. GY 40078]